MYITCLSKFVQNYSHQLYSIDKQNNISCWYTSTSTIQHVHINNQPQKWEFNTQSAFLQHFSYELSPSYTHAPYTVMTLQPQHGAQITLHQI